MTVFFVISSSLIALNALLLLFSSNRRIWGGRSSALSNPEPANPKALQLNTFDSEYQKAV